MSFGRSGLTSVGFAGKDQVKFIKIDIAAGDYADYFAWVTTLRKLDTGFVAQETVKPCTKALNNSDVVRPVRKNQPPCIERSAECGERGEADI